MHPPTNNWRLRRTELGLCGNHNGHYNTELRLETHVVYIHTTLTKVYLFPLQSSFRFLIVLRRVQSNMVIALSFSFVNTLLKYSSRISAFSISVFAMMVLPSWTVCNSDTLDLVFLLLLTYDQKLLQLVFAVSAICFSLFFLSLVIIDFALFLAFVYSL